MGASVVRRVAGPVWDWWSAEMLAILAAVGPQPRILEITLGDRLLTLALRRGVHSTAIGEIAYDPGAPSGSAGALATLLRKTPGAFDRLEVVAAPGQGLRRTLRFPRAAEADLHEAARYELDRQTPFSEDSAYFGVEKTATDRENGQVELTLHVLPRAKVDPVLDLLSAAGLRADCLKLSAGERIDLLPAARRHRTRWLRPALVVSLALVAVLAVANVVLPYYAGRTALEAAELRAATARQAAAETLALRRELDELRDREARLVERKNAGPLTLDLLRELTRRLPDSAYLVQFTVVDGTISLTGYADHAAPLLAELERGAAFEEVRLSESVIRDSRFGAERFSMSMTVPGLLPEAKR